VPAELDDALQLLRAQGFAAPNQVTLLRGGNNRSFRLDGPDFSVVAKLYFSSELDPRDRLGAEFSFSQLLWSQGRRDIPQPLFCDPRRKIGVYQALAGRKLQAEEIDQSKAQLMLKFFSDLNSLRAQAGGLRPASEACFSLLEHSRTISGRLDTLETTEEPLVQEFAARLRGLWRDIQPRLLDERELEAGQRCLSPSDFGFHNALWDQDRLYWLDFEYAGWDDPAKAACDAVCQPDLPLPPQAWGLWMRQLDRDFGAAAVERAERLILAYKIKWCCIILASFSAAGRARRNYSGQTHQLEVQLAKAQKLMAS
jgi:hypothetical protein